MTTTRPIIQAVKNGHIEAVELLLQLNAKPCWWCAKHAIMRDDMAMLKLLVSYSAMPLCGNHLRLAAMHGSMKVGRYIIEQGVDVSDASHIGCTALHYAITNGHVSFIKLVLDNNPSQEDIHMAAHTLGSATTYTCIQHLMDYGVDVWPMAFLAVANNRYDMVEWLLDHAIDINIRYDDAKYTLLHAAVVFATHQDPYDIVKLLIDRDIDVYALDINGNTAYDLAYNGEFGPHIVRIIELLESSW